MDEKNWAKKLLLISWLVLFPLFLCASPIWQETYTTTYYQPMINDEFIKIKSLNTGRLISELLSLYIINSFIVFLFLLIHSLIKLSYYRSDVERKIIYKKRMIRYFIFLGITFFILVSLTLLSTNLLIGKVNPF